MSQKKVVRAWMMSASALVLAGTFAGQAHAEIFDVRGEPLLFKGSGTGTGNTKGSFREYADVITIGGKRIKARVTLTELSSATLSSFDSTTTPYPADVFFQPNLSFTAVGGYATFRVDFFDENNQPAILQNFYVNTYDLDGANGSASGRQYTEFSGFASYSLSTGTKVVKQDRGSVTRFITTVGGNLEYTPGEDNFNTIRARVFYTEASSVTFNLGDTGATGAAYFGLDFSVGYAFNNIVLDATAPIVTGAQKFFYVEDRAANSLLGTVAATDNIGVTNFRFATTSTQTSSDGFYVIDNTGAVRLTATGAAAGIAQNDFDILPNSFDYSVQAADAAGNWSSAVSINLNVTAAPPKITGPSGGAGAAASARSVNENQTAATTLTADRGVTWAITGGADASKFTINASTGEVTFVTAPDFEVPTDADTNNVYVFVVTATDSGARTASQTVSITVLDVADNAPVITVPGGAAGATSSALTINENATAVATLTSNVPATWTVTGGEDAAKFTINAATGALSFIAGPDYENPTDADTANTYVVVVTATGTNALATAHTITVTVLNLAEPAPVLTAPGGSAGAASSAVSVDENQTAVMTMAADRRVDWSITGGADAAKFTIDASTGVVTFVAAPDYEAPTDADRNNVYLLVVTATDANNETAAQSIAVTVLDLAEPAPVLTAPGGSAGAASSAVSVDENQTAVMTMAADRRVDWSITGGADAAKFTIDASTGVVTFVAAPDYEAPTDADRNNVYLLVVTATDANNETAAQSIAVTVLNLAEPAPVLTGPSGGPGATTSSIDVDENETLVTSLTADRPVTWAISGGADAPLFVLEAAPAIQARGAVPAILSFAVAPDYEDPTDADTNNIYVVELTATDDNNETAVQTILVTVIDVDEPLPVLTGPSGDAGAAASAVAVDENQTAVATLMADRRVVWAITGGADAGKLSIDPATGIVTFISAPNYEEPTDADGDNVYLIEVTATDGNNEAAVQMLAVTVLDVVDTAPIVMMPGEGVVGASVAIAMMEEQMAVTTLASSRPVTWAISGGSDGAHFHIGATGALAFLSAPDFTVPTDDDGDNTYIVEVTATDDWGMTAVHTLRVTIENNDHAAPVITGPDGVAGAASSEMNLAEGVTQVTTFYANESVTWSLVGGTDQAFFVIDDSTGDLTLLSAKSFETPEDSDKNNSYVVAVRAVDAVGNSRDHTLTVRITDVDEVAPRIAAIAKELRADLRTYAFNSLGDMLSFNEGIVRDTGDCVDTAANGDLRPGMRLNELNQGTSLDWAKTRCSAHYRVIANAGAAIDHSDGDWTRRGLASVRLETELKPDVTLGVGLMGSFANNDLPSFVDGSISDETLQINAYLKANLAENLRAGAFAGYGRAWYDFDVHQPGFDLTGKMVGRRQVYGAMLSGDMEVGKVLVTTDVILSRATEDLGEAKLTGTVADDTRKSLFAVGDVDMTRISIPMSGEFNVWGRGPKGWNSTLRLSPGLLCEDTSADTSSLTCGYQFGGRFIAKREGSGGGYLDYRIESVDSRTRNMIGLGYEYTFGPRRNLEWAVDVSGGVVDDRPDGRAMITFRAR